ncbi:MAG: [FeFe] hydrogenase H-cluster radical SAM maturase HydG [Deltaproteobacteria bacterium]|nr:[FeFe] hydrogenase H-cluster radical SAM maturase HydG [Deltaproteobacteria bacterium]
MSFINLDQIQSALNQPCPDPGRVRDVLARARTLVGLEPEQAALLTRVTDAMLLEEIFSAARGVKETIYGKRLVLFAPLYISNRCQNECLYCGFRRANADMQRMSLSQAQIADEVRCLTAEGHKRLLLVAGEQEGPGSLRYVLDSIATIYACREPGLEIRRVNVNIAPLETEEFRQLAASRIGTYQLFQETYHPQTYVRMHPSGPKADYGRRLLTMHRAMQAGINDVGIGALFGLHDWRFELLSLLQHSRELEKTFGSGPHTISVPRLEPASGSALAARPPAAVSDEDFLKLIAILRLAVPYTGIILSTRETPGVRRAAFALGVSQISAGSRTTPGGYGHTEDETSGQFSLGDHRSLDEVIADIAQLGYIPSFCTACYRLGRTGADFMDLARPGAIKAHCDPNALATFQEYLNRFASDETRRIGGALIEDHLQTLDAPVAATARNLLQRMAAGETDVYC